LANSVVASGDVTFVATLRTLGNVATASSSGGTGNVHGQARISWVAAVGSGEERVGDNVAISGLAVTSCDLTVLYRNSSARLLRV